MRILFLSTFFPYPLDTGSAVRVYHLLQALAARHKVHLLSFMPRAESEAFIPTLRDWGIQVEVVHRDPFQRQPRKAVTGHFSLKPRDVIACYSPEMMHLATQAAQRTAFDLVIASTTLTAPYALAIAGVPRILEEHNFMTAWMEERFRSRHPGLKKILAWITWQKCQRYERWLYPQFDLATMVSERDCAAVEAAIPEYTRRVAVVPNGVDTIVNRPGLADPEPETLVFNGALTYYANADAMRYFLSEIFPLIHHSRPEARLKITGRTEGVDLSALPLNGKVALTGYLEDVRPAVAGSWVCVVPLRIGSGTRLKILEAMALGTPVVATSKGAEGLEVTAGEDILIADEPGEFARQTLRLLGDPDLRQRLARNGRAVVEQKYDWAGIGAQFCALAEALAAVRFPARAK
jgi:glycosyltransferase involved in cell wall biosynthesis